MINIPAATVARALRRRPCHSHLTLPLFDGRPQSITRRSPPEDCHIADIPGYESEMEGVVAMLQGVSLDPWRGRWPRHQLALSPLLPPL